MIKPAFPTTSGLSITSKYGWRIDPVNGGQQFHYAIDIGGGGVNHPIYATQSGEVIYNQWTDYGGWTVRIQHSGDEYFSQYQHLAEQSNMPIGAKVGRGEQIGIMGTTGDSTGIHLDFMIATTINGWWTESGTIDPEIYLNMEFDGGGGTPTDPDPTPKNDKQTEVIKLLLAGTLNGW